MAPLPSLPELCIDVRSEGTVTDQASQVGRRLTLFEDYLRITSQSKDEEVHLDMSSEGISTCNASQDSQEATFIEGHVKSTNRQKSKVKPTSVVNDNYRHLFEAALKGDWKAAKKILNKDPKAITAKVMTVEDQSFTVLEVAVMAAQDHLVEKLVRCLSQEYEDSILQSALCHAARGGRIRMVKTLAEKVDDETNALFCAISCAPMQKDVIWYLARCRTSAPSYHTMICLIIAGHLDICFYFARQFPGLATSEDTENRSLLGDLAIMRSCFRSGVRLNFWENFIYKLPFIKRIGELKSAHKYSLEFADLALSEKKTHMKYPQILEFLLTSHIVIDAASRGISEIVKLFLTRFPELMWDINFTKELVKEVVNGRHVELVRVMNAHNTIPYLTDNMIMNRELMEAVIKWTPRCESSDVSRAAFLMQRELQWFKVVEDRSFPSFRNIRFEDDQSIKRYWDTFAEKRKGLLKDAGQWMKDTSSSCSLVATLIITVAFAAAFTVPGGNDSSRGIPIFLNKGSFKVFLAADALALFSSITATLMFLAILTSRYSIEDFLHSLPRKMILGLTFLFLSLASMLVAFGSALMIILSEQLKWIYMPITLLAAFPIVLFTILQIPLYVEMVESTYRPRLYRPLKIWK